MKLTDITTNRARAESIIPTDECDAADYGAARNSAYPELAVLLNARTANSVMNCKLLARDELELANLVLNRMDVDPHYEPSMTLLDAVRSINAKLALCPVTTAQ